MVRESLANCHDRDTIAGLTRLQEPHSFETTPNHRGAPHARGKLCPAEADVGRKLGALVGGVPASRQIGSGPSACIGMLFHRFSRWPGNEEGLRRLPLPCLASPENRIIVSGYEPLCIEKLFILCL